MNAPMLTTVDNPFNPFTQYDQWYAFDNVQGYHSCELLDRVLKISPNLGNTDTELLIRNAIDEIIKFDVFGIYKKVEKNEAFRPGRVKTKNNIKPPEGGP